MRTVRKEVCTVREREERESVHCERERVCIVRKAECALKER